MSEPHSLAAEVGKLIDWLAEEGYDQENYDFLFTVQNELRSLQAENERLRGEGYHSIAECPSALTHGAIATELEQDWLAEIVILRERLAATEAENERLRVSLNQWHDDAMRLTETKRRLKERLAATEAVAKRFRDGWTPGIAYWRKAIFADSMSDAERQVVDRLNEPSDDG